MTGIPAWSLSEDRTKAVIEFPTQPPVQFDMDVDALDDLISTLGRVRRDMLPAPIAADPDVGSRLEVCDASRWFLAPQPDGRLLVAIFHPGYRWVATLVGSENLERFIEIAKTAKASG